jgi:hypothetical protein
MADQLAQRLAGDGTDMLLELRDRGAVERPVSGIVHPRRDLVDQDFRAARHSNRHAPLPQTIWRPHLSTLILDGQPTQHRANV